jgi:hypothetical protein
MIVPAFPLSMGMGGISNTASCTSSPGLREPTGQFLILAIIRLHGSTPKSITAWIRRDSNPREHFQRVPGAGRAAGRHCAQTVRGKGWFILRRLYGPLEPWFDKTWQPDDILTSARARLKYLLGFLHGAGITMSFDHTAPWET